MAIENNYFDQFLSEDSPERSLLEKKLEALKESSPLLDLVNQKKVELGLKAEQKKSDFVNQEFSFEQNYDGDTLYGLGRLSSGDGNPKGFSFDTFETAKYEADGTLKPYLGSVDPTDGSKRSKKWNLHRAAYAKIHGIPTDYVSQRMLNEAGAKQAEAFKAALYKGQDPNSDSVSVDIRQDGEGYFGRPLITVRNPVTGEIINEVMNTRENNAMFYSKYNQEKYSEGVLSLNSAMERANESVGKGFWDSAGKGLSQGIDGLQATGYGLMALVVDATGNKELGTWFLDQYLRNLDEAQANGANLPRVEDVDWSNPTAALSKLGALIGEAMPSIALMIGTGGVGGLIAKQAVKGGVKKLVGKGLSDDAAKLITKAQGIGRGVGAYGAAMGMETGSIYGDVAVEGNRDWKAIGGSLAGGTIAGALEAFYPLKLMKKFGLSRAKVSKATDRSVLRNNLSDNFKAIGKGMLTGGAQEGITETLQFVVEEITQDLIKKGHLPDFGSAEFKSGLLNSFVAGLVPGSTLSGGASLISETGNRLRGDQGATQQAVNELKQQEATAVNEESVGDPDIQSVENVANNINTIENSAESLGLNLNESYKNFETDAQKASYLALALNQLEVTQKSLPKGERNAEVITARKAIEGALNNLNTGNATTSRQAKEQVIRQRAARQSAGVTDKAKLAAIEQQRDAAISVLNAKQTRYDKKGVAIITKAVNTDIEKINSINEQLKDPNLSKAKIKNLTRLRNQLGVKIDKASKDKEGTKIAQLDKTLFANIDKALASFEFKNKKSNLREDRSVAEDFQEVVNEANDGSLETISAKTIKTLNNKKSTDKERADAINSFTKIYNKAKRVKAKIEEQLKTVTDKAERKALQKTLEDINKKIAGVESAVDAVLEQESTTVEDSKKDILYSLNPLNQKQIDELKKIDNLSKTEQALLDAHIEVYKAKKEVDDNAKDINDVRNDVLLGEVQFKGFMLFLKLAQANKPVIKRINYFLGKLKSKLSRFEDAQKLLKDKNLSNVWISKENYGDPILEVMPTIEKDGKQVEDKDNYFFVNKGSINLMQSIKEEIAFGEAILNLVKQINSNESVTKRQKNREALDKSVKEVKKAKPTNNTTDLDDIKTENVKPETAKPKEEVSKPETTEEETIDYSNPDKFILPEFMWKFQNNLVKLGAGVMILNTTATKGVISFMEVSISATKPYFLARTGKRGTEQDFENKTRFEEWLTLQAKIEAEQNKARELIAEVKEKTKQEAAKQKSKPEDSTEQSATAASNTNSKVKHFLNKYGGLVNGFLKLYRTKLKGSDIFKIAQPERKSFYSKYDSWSPGIDTLLQDYLGENFEDKEFITYLNKYFIEFKTSFEEYNRKVKTKKGDSSTAFHSQEFLQLLYVEIDGVKTLPDEIIFAMMLSTLEYISINNYNTEVTSEQEIGLLLYNDMQADLSRQELMDFGNIGVLFKDAATEIGSDAFNSLNLKVDSSQLKGDSLKEVLDNINEYVEKNGSGLLPSELIAEQLKIALGATALAVSTSVHANDKKTNKLDGLIEIVYATYYHETFDGTPSKDLKEGDYGKGMPTRVMKTIKFPYLQERNVPFGLEKLFESIKNNKKTIANINGTDSELSGPLAKPREAIQKFVRGSFIEIPKKTRNVIEALQKVPWLGKTKALELWGITDESTREKVVGIVDLESKHVTERPGFKTANEDKFKDIKLIDEYDGKPFWFKYSAQKQNRINIQSNGINGQRSKPHRALFMPKGSDVTVDTELKRAVYQLAIAQAFGYSIDKHTLQDSLLEFDKLFVESEELVNYIKAGNLDSVEYNKLLNKFLDNKNIKVDPSMHVIEAIASLTNYHPTKSFKSGSLGIESDGITNGFAIAQLQFLGVPEDILTNGTDAEIVASLVESLARLGVMVEPGMTMEKFIREGNLDVYQSLANFIKETLVKPDALNTINDEKKDFVKKITKEQIAALDLVHGEIWETELKKEITKFGRNLAKNPLMISGYGAEITRIITALAADAIPTINNKLAEFQVEFDNAKTTREKKAILDEFTIYAKALNTFIPGSYEITKEKKVKGLTVLLKKGKLKEKVFKDSEIKNVEKAYQAIFTPAITTALNQFTKPLQEARDAIIQSGERQYVTFMFYFDQGIEAYKKTNAYINSPSKLVPLEVEEAIARPLALKYMPMIYGEWSGSNSPLQVIKTAQIEGNQDLGRVVVPVPRKVFPKIRKNGFKFKVVRDSKGDVVMSDTYSLDSHANARQYVTPSVSIYSNSIQNVDSVLIGKLILKNPNVLNIFDAAMSDIENAYSDKTTYNEGFRNTGLNHSVLGNALKRLTDVKNAIKPGDIIEIEKIYREGKKDKEGNVIYKPSFQAQALLDAMAKMSDKSAIAILQAEYDALSFKQLEKKFEKELKRIKLMKTLLNKVYGTKDKDGKLIEDSWLKNATISQMYMAESLELIKNGLETIESIKGGANIDVQTDAVIEPQEEVAESQVDPENANTKVIIVEGTAAAKQYARNNPDSSVYVMRPNDGDNLPHIKVNQNFGNPWSARDLAGTIKVKDIETAVNNYRDWLEGTAHQDIAPNRRNFILKQIEKGFFDNKQLIYFKGGYTSHADVLAESQVDPKNATTNEVEQVQETTTTASGVTQTKSLFTKLNFEDVKKAIKRDEKSSKRFGWIATWYGPIDYEYSGIKHEAQEMSPGFANIARKLEKRLGHPDGYYNSALMNVFPKGKGIGKHADDEFIYIRDNDTIGSVATISLGSSAEITISRNDNTQEDEVFTVEDGDLYVMPDGVFQRENKHSVGKATGERISMTFRHIPRSQLREVGPIEKEVATVGDPYVLFQDSTGNDVFTNAGQTTVINKMKEWWKSADKMFVLAGRGGTGKTTIVEKALNELKVNKDKVLFALPTHKSKNVIAKATSYREDQYTTLASLLGQTKQYNAKTQEWSFEKDLDKFEASMKALEKQGINLIVIDEVSMVTEEFLVEISKISNDMNIRVIFMGDNVQLPPIEDNKGNIGLSAVFDNVMGFNNKTDLGINVDNYVKLTERMRQGKESPILGVTDIIANTIEWLFKNPRLYNGSKKDTGFILPKVPENSKQDGVHYMEGTLKGGLTDATLDKFVEEYSKDPANVKYIHFNKESKARTISIRSRIREKLFPNIENSGDLNALPFIEGERIVMGESVAAMKDNKAMRSVDLNNGDEVTVTQELRNTEVTVETTGNFGKAFSNIPVRILRVKTDEDLEYNLVFDDGQRTKDAIRKQQSENQNRYNMEKKVIDEVTTSEVSAGYLLNTHKSQGSTYKTVYVDYENIMGNQSSPDWLTKLQSLYVATSRPSERLVLVGTGDLAFGTEGKDLSENIEILKNLENNEESSPRDSEELYSLDNDLDIEMKSLWDTDSLTNTAQNIFNKLGNHFKTFYPNSQEQAAQQSHLQRVLNEIILPTGNALDNVSVELFSADVKAFGAVNLTDKNVSIVLNNKKPNSFSEQTAQEAYLHEIIHILTNSALAKDSTFRNNIADIRNSVKKELRKMDRPYEIFLHKDVDGKIITLTDAATEIQAAKEQYNYLFGPTKPPKYVLDEFLAYALTNKHLVRQLSTMPAKVVPLWNKESDANVIEKIIDLFTELVNRLTNLIQKKPVSGTLDMKIFQLTKELVNVSHSQAGTVRNILQRQNLARDYDKANEVASNFLKKTVTDGVKFTSDQYIKGVDKLTKDGKINNFFANVLYDSKLAVLMTSSYGTFINNNPKVQRYLDAAFKNFKPGLKQNMASLKADAFGGINEDFIRLLYKSQKEVDVARRQYKQLTGESLLNEFIDLDSVTANEKQALTRVLLKADFSILEATGAYNMEDAIKLLNDDAFLQEQVDKYAGILDITNNKHYAAQTESLAEFMMLGNQFNNNQFKNAHLIHQKNTTNSKATVEEIDVYVTLLSLQKHVEPYSKKEVRTVINREFKGNKDANGITNLIYHHISFKENSRKENFNDNPVLMTKGYIAKITNPTIQIEFESMDAVTKKRMEDADYKLVSGFESVTGVGDSNYGIYVNYNLPDAMRTKGIASVTSLHHAGSSLKEILSRNPETEGQINLLIKRFTQTQTEKQNTLDKNHTMMPIVNEKGKIVDYTIHMNHGLVERLLEQELAFDQVLPTMYSHSLDKASSEKINREAIDLLDAHTTLNYSKEPQKYVNILEGENRDEYFNVLPLDTRNYILDLATENKKKKGSPAFYVERKLLDTVFGYKMPSIGNAPLIRNNKKVQKYAKITEKLMFELVALSKVNIVIKIPAVLAFNILSNFTTSVLYGIPPTYLVKKWREGFKELERYQKEHKKLQLLELKQVGNPALRNDVAIQNQQEVLKESLNNNKVAKLMDMGLFTSITEDINKNDFTYRHQSMSTLRNTKVGKKFDNMFKGNVVKVANQAYIGEETALFKTMMHLTQSSDFIARYAMYSHAIEVKNMDENKAYKQMVETFVNYDQPLNRYLQYGNDIGLLFFIKYWLRIQRATFNIAKEKPLNIGMLYVGNTMLGFDFESIMESSILAGNFFPTSGGPLKVLEEVLILPGLEILSGESLGLT